MTRRKGEWNGEQLSAIEIEHLLKSLSIKTKNPASRHTRPKLDEKERMSFHVLAGTYSEETFTTLKELDKLFPGLKNMQNPDIYFKMSPLMTSLFNGNFIYANFLLDLGVDIEAQDSLGKNILLHAATATHIADYRDPETVESFQLEEKLESLFGQSQTIAEDQMQTFQRIFSLKDWFQSMNVLQIHQLLITLQKKRDIFDFVIDQWQHHPDYDKKIELLMQLPIEHADLFCEIADRWREQMEIKPERSMDKSGARSQQSIIKKFIEMGFFSKPEIKRAVKLPAETDPKPEIEASAAIPNPEIATRSGPIHNQKVKDATETTSPRK